ncbi:MAG TPA: helix-turn-helix domain-containing protein [Thermoleophilaceae bacterium]
MSSEKRKYELKARAEGQEDTRRRIVQATMELHQEVGPARTTIAEIARRAGVNRVTVYNHFPEESELVAACQRHYLSLHPPPDLADELAIEDPAQRVRAVLRSLYRSYREREPMAVKILRDRSAVPALDALLAQTLDPAQAALTDVVAASLGRGRRKRALVALALDFWTWHRLTSEGLSDNEAADLMAQLLG